MDSLHAPAPENDHEERSEPGLDTVYSDDGNELSPQPLLNLRNNCPPRNSLFFFPNYQQSIFPDAFPQPTEIQSPAVFGSYAGQEVATPSAAEPSGDPRIESPMTVSPAVRNEDEFAETDRLIGSAGRISMYTSLFVASQWADKRNIFKTFFPGMFEPDGQNGADADSKSKKTKKVITNPVVRGNRYASGVNPLTGAIWGPGNAWNVLNSLSMLANGNFADGLRFLWESSTNLATYISAHTHKNLAAAKAAQLGSLNPMKWWHSSIAAIAQNAADKDKNGHQKEKMARKRAAEVANAGNLAWRDVAKARWDLAMAKLGRKDIITSLAHLAPRVSPASGAAFAGLSFVGRSTRPDSAVNTAAMASDVASFVGLGLQFWAQEKEKFFKNHRLLAPLLPWMIRGAMLSWFAQIPGRFSDLYQAHELLVQAGDSMPDRYKRYHGPQHWMTTLGHRFMDDPSVVTGLFPDTGTMLYTKAIGSMVKSGVPDAVMQSVASAMVPDASASPHNVDASTARSNWNPAFIGYPIGPMGMGMVPLIPRTSDEVHKNKQADGEGEAPSLVPSKHE